MQFAPEHIQNVIWIQTAFIGDTILATSAMELLHKKYPHIRQFAVATPLGAQIFKGHPGIEEAFALDKTKSYLRALLDLRQNIFEQNLNPTRTLILRAHKSFRSAVLSKLLGYPTVTFQTSVLAFLAKAAVPYRSELHESQRISELLEPLGFSEAERRSARPFLNPLPLREGIPWQQEILTHTKPLVLLAPGSVWATKCWPAEKFAEIALRLKQTYDAGLVLSGSPGEAPLIEVILKKLHSSGYSSNVWNLAGKSSLEDLRRVYPRLSLVVANDSAPTHFASAFNIPTVTIFGATIPAYGFGPLAQGSRIAEVKGLDCRPCGKHGATRCPKGHFRCMKDLSADHVWQLCTQTIKISADPSIF